MNVLWESYSPRFVWLVPTPNPTTPSHKKKMTLLFDLLP